MYIKIDEDLYKKIQNITSTDYDAIGDFIPSESIVPMIEDLLCEIEHLEEELGNLEHDLQENYKPISLYEMYDISEKDFY